MKFKDLKYWHKKRCNKCGLIKKCKKYFDGSFDLEQYQTQYRCKDCSDVK